MATRLFCCLLVVLLAASVSPAATKSIQCRGWTVELKEADDLIFVRTKGAKSAGDVATKLIRAQAKAVGGNPARALVKLALHPARYIAPLGGVIIPRLEGIKTPALDELAAAADEATSAQPVYRVGRQTVVPLKTITVRTKGNLPPRLLFALTSDLNLKEIERPTFATGVVRYEVPEDADVFEICNALSKKPLVQWAEPDLVVQLLECGGKIPNDEFFEKQWYLQPGENRIGAPEAWELSQGTDKITVAVLDDGIDMQHPDLKDKLLAGYDFFTDDEDPQPDEKDAHGTACAGIIGAITNNGQGTSGICWNARILPVRISGTDGFASYPNIAKAIEFSAEKGAKILSCSWGGQLPSNQLLDAIDAACDKGCLVICAAGNARPAVEVYWPAQHEKCIAVGATTRENKIWDYSCFGPSNSVDIVAPSGDVNLKGDIWTTDHSEANGYNPGQAASENDEPSGNYTGHFGGTSASCPVVAGVAALVWSTYPKLTSEQVREILQTSAVKIDSDGGDWQGELSDKYGHGMVHALGALKLAAKVSGDDQLADDDPAPDNDVTQAQQGSWGVPAENKPATNARNLLQQLLKHRKSKNIPLLFTPKEPANSKHIDFQKKQLDILLKPQKTSYSVRGREVMLEPSDQWFVMRLASDSREEGAEFWRIVRADATEKELQTIEVAAKTADRVVVVVPRNVLRKPDELKSLADRAALPPISPSYRLGKSLVVPLGSITFRLDRGDALETMLQWCQEQHLELMKVEKDTLRVSLTAQCAYADVFAATAEIAKQSHVKWAEPDFATRLLRDSD